LSGGCATHDALTRTASAPPAAFEQRTSIESRWPAKDWYAEFGSHELNALIALAARSNSDMAAAQARIRQADARARAAGAALLPQLDAVGNASYNAGHSADGTAHETDWSALLSTSYELDFWGKNRESQRAASLLAAASRADRDTIQLTAFAGIADTYFEVLALRERLSIAQANLESSRGLLQAVQARYDAGVAGPVELASQKAAVAADELAVPILQQRESEARGALALLAGSAPENFSVDATQLEGLTEPIIAPGLPSELLQRRPDIFVAEADLLAAHADLQAARAALFPSLKLTATAGVQNPAMNAAVITLTGTGYGLVLGANLVQTIFDDGRLRAQREEAAGREEELLASYRSAILHAFLDVENALGAFQYLQIQRQSQEDALTQSERAFNGAELRYRAGSGDFLSVLVAQRAAHAARERWVEYKLARLRALVGLCKALGGGWQAPGSSTSSVENGS
jgi:NodT family efflux transporter outer membrane factor (OMF) lipoprotein